MSCKATLSDLIEALTQNMTVTEMAQTALHIQISRMIRDARRKLRMSQKDLADKMGVKQSLISRWESGDCNYTIDTLVEIANALNLSVQCPLTYDEVDVITEPAQISAPNAHTVVSQNTDFSNAIWFDVDRAKTLKKETGGAA